MKYERYKSTGISWLPEVPEEWEITRIRCVFNWRREKNNPVKSTDRLSLSIDKGVTRYDEKTTNLDRFKDDFTEYLLAYPNDIVLNSMNMIVGAVGKSSYFGCVSPAYYVITLKDKTHNIDFFARLLNIQAIRDVYHVLGRGICAIERGNGKVNTCRLKVPYNSFGFIQIPLPSSSTQRAIVAYLDDKCGKIDSFVAAKEREAELLKEYKQSLIAKAVTRGLDENVELRVETGVFWQPRMPQSWSVRKLRHVLRKLDRPRPTDAELLVCTNKGKVVKKGEAKIGLVSEDESIYQGVAAGDLLIHGMDTWHGAIAVSELDGMCTPVVHVCDSAEDKRFIAYCLQNMARGRLFKLISNGVRQNTSDFRSWEKVAQLPVVLPPLPEQRAIVAYIEEKGAKIDAQVASLEREAELLREYKQSLIADVVTGRRKVTP